MIRTGLTKRTTCSTTNRMSFDIRDRFIIFTMPYPGRKFNKQFLLAILPEYIYGHRIISTRR